MTQASNSIETISVFRHSRFKMRTFIDHATGRFHFERYDRDQLIETKSFKERHLAQLAFSKTVEQVISIHNLNEMRRPSVNIQDVVKPGILKRVRVYDPARSKQKSLFDRYG